MAAHCRRNHYIYKEVFMKQSAAKQSTARPSATKQPEITQMDTKRAGATQPAITQMDTKRAEAKQPAISQTDAKQPNYGNWIPRTLMGCLWGLAALCLVLWLFSACLIHLTIAGAAALLLMLFFLAMAFYMQICRNAFSFTGGRVMQEIHKALLGYLPFDGSGTMLDIGCGSGALSVLCAKTWPHALITGIDYWSREWNYAKEQCEENARIERVTPITFLQGDAAALPFDDESFDAAVSNFVFHEVRTQPDKRQVVREALRVVKKGGVFAFHDLFEQTAIYGSMDDFVKQLEAEGISEIHYLPHTENMDCIPWYVKAPWLLSDLGILYGVK